MPNSKGSSKTRDPRAANMPQGWRFIGDSWFKMGDDIEMYNGTTLPGQTTAWTMPSEGKWKLFAYRKAKAGAVVGNVEELGVFENASVAAVAWELGVYEKR